MIDNALNDKVNDSYGFIFALSQFIAPNIGSMYYEAKADSISAKGDDARMPNITDKSMIVNFVFAAILFVFNCGPFVFSENRAFQKRLEVLRLKNVPEEEKEEAREIAKSIYSNNTIGQVFKTSTYSKKNSIASTSSISRTVQPKGTFSGG